MSKAFRLTIFLFLLALTSCQLKPSKEEQARNMEEFMMRNGYEWTQLYQTKTGHLTATLKINGQNAVMLLDTGGGATVLDYKQMDHFGLKARATHDYAAGIGETRAQLAQAKADISIGKVTLKGFGLYVMDMYNVNVTFKRNRSMQVDGVLGSDLIEQLHAVIDYDNHRLYVKP